MTRLVDRARVWLGRLTRLTRLSALETAMNDEMQHHIECEIAERLRAGESPDAARLSALRDFGGIERTKEDVRDARGLRTFEDVVADARHAFRVFRRTPGSTLAVIATFALGIAAAGASFTIVYGILLRPLPYADPDRLVAVWERNTVRNLDRNVASVENFQSWQRTSASFSGLAALVPRPATLLLGPSSERVIGAEVSPEYFRMLGVTPMLGRDFEATDARSSGATVAIVSYDAWTRRFGADPGVVGRTLRLSEGAYTIVGVMPASFEPPRFHWLGTQEMWFPFAATPENARWGRFLLVVGRLRPDVTIARAQAEMAAIAERLAGESPANRGWGVTIVPLADQMTGDVSTALRTLLAAVGLLFLIAVANVTTLTATAARKRSQEMALRRSLGATDARIFRQLFTQHTLLGLGGAVVGVAAIPACVGIMIALAPPALPRQASIRVDATTLGATIAIVAAAIAAFSAIAASVKRVRIGSGRLVVCEIAVALTLGIMATLMARTINGLRHVDLGFESDGVVAARMALAGRDADGANATVIFDELLGRIRSIPSVEAAAIVNTRPLGGPGPATQVSDPGANTVPKTEIVTDIRYASADVFETLRIPVVAGHTFDAHDGTSSPITVVVSESLARALWPAQPAIGRTLRLDLFNGLNATVVGVAGDVHFMDARTPVRPAAYLSSARFPDGTRDIVVRTTGDPAAIVPMLRAHVAALAPGVPLYQVEEMTDAVEATRAPERFTAFLLSAFASIAALLGSVGVFGVIASEVGRRHKEIGVRLALGATRSAVSWLMLRQTIVRAAFGTAAGVVLARWLAQSMTTLLFGVTPLDPVSYLAAIACVIALSLVATMIPVVQALRQSPLAALREN